MYTRSIDSIECMDSLELRVSTQDPGKGFIEDNEAVLFDLFQAGCKCRGCIISI